MSQPIDAYPNPEMTDQASPSRSNGSFGPVFAVLAVIVVISAVACVLGRLCSKRSHHTKKKKKAEHGHPPKASKGLPKEWESKQKPNFDIEIGFDKRMPPKNGGGKPQPYQNGGGKPKPPHQNGGHNKPVDIRFSNNV
ncbi:hypothetical protein AAHA92_18750 [Salvia divinorum]|uniref:Transmembrane protein n=1 Tax=Salvia divinorum TaxID=28513 RepID=A0ABD1H4B9_SALDI